MVRWIAAGLATAAAAAPLAAVPQAVPQTARAVRPLFLASTPVALLVEAETGALLFARDADRLIAPASMTKAMTAYVVLDLIKRGELAADDIFTVRPETWAKWRVPRGGSSMFLSAGEQVSVDDLLRGLLAVSGNDAAAVLAEGIDGSEAAFVARMNRVARQIGLADSRFGTSNGWPDGGRTMVTARDLARLAARIIADHPAAYRRYFGAPGMSWGRDRDGNPYIQANRNPLLGRVAGADGLKTGFTDAAGFCLLGSVQRGDRRLILVVAGAVSEAQRRDAATRLAEWGFARWQVAPLIPAAAVLGKARVQGGTAAAVPLTTAGPVRLSLPAGHSGAHRLAIRYRGPLAAPVAARAHVADLVITPDGLPPQRRALYAANTVAPGNWLDRLRTGFVRLTGQ